MGKVFVRKKINEKRLGKEIFSTQQHYAASLISVHISHILLSMQNNIDILELYIDP